ncbi:MAG: DedA family protein [Thiohalomonadales bacterium]|nr:DedA family protein [Thiohalomonadales bacterium]
MSLEHFIDSYGYLAILIGTFLEGETILILGGITAKLGYLQLNWVIACAFLGTLIGDQLFFLLGRYLGAPFLDRHPSWVDRARKVESILERHRILIILGFRFIYGFRTITPYVIGMSRISFLEFFVLNVISAAVWSIIIGLLGFAFGHGLELWLGNIRHYEIRIMLVVILTGTLIWIIHFAYLRHKQKKATD